MKLLTFKRSKMLKQLKTNKRVNFISLFAGGGGSSLGYNLAGFNELCAYEYDPKVAEVFKTNFPDVPVDSSDIFHLKAKDVLKSLNLKVGELDHIDASPPCPGFSRSNTNRTPDDKRNQLFLKTIDLIEGIRPKTFLIENVTGMLDSLMTPFWKKLKEKLASLNYEVRFGVVEATMFGVPQARRRVIFVGVRKDIFVEDVPFFPEAVTNKEQMVVSKHCPDILALSSGQFQKTVKLAFCNPSPTITRSSPLEVYDVNNFIKRCLTIEELKVLSGFPVEFKLQNKYLFSTSILGNSVPPPITYHIGCHLLKHFHKVEVIEE